MAARRRRRRKKDRRGFPVVVDLGLIGGLWDNCRLVPAAHMRKKMKLGFALLVPLCGHITSGMFVAIPAAPAQGYGTDFQRCESVLILGQIQVACAGYWLYRVV